MSKHSIEDDFKKYEVIFSRSSKRTAMRILKTNLFSNECSFEATILQKALVSTLLYKNLGGSMKNHLVDINIDSFNNTPIELPLPSVIEVRSIDRADGYRLPSSHCVAIKVQYEQIQIEGFGEASTYDIAYAKALSEAYERFAFYYSVMLGIKSGSSNGWASHMTSELASESAVCEIIERDVAMNAWQNFGPYLRIPQNLWPSQLIIWEKNKLQNLEFNKIEVLLSCDQNRACVSVLLLNSKNNFVSGHASGLNLTDAILSAAQECFRAAHLALRFEYFSEVRRLHSTGYENEKPFEPGVHALAYAYQASLPDTIAFENCDEASIISFWNNHKVQATKWINQARQLFFKVADRIIVKTEIEGISKMYWGRANDRDQNTNKHPHIVG